MKTSRVKTGKKPKDKKDFLNLALQMYDNEGVKKEVLSKDPSGLEMPSVMSNISIHMDEDGEIVVSSDFLNDDDIRGIVGDSKPKTSGRKSASKN